MKKLAVILGTVVLAAVAVLGAATPASAWDGYGYRSWWGGAGPYARSYSYRSSYAFAPRHRVYRSHRYGFGGRPYRSWWGGP
jgi:hypothetical protein